MRREYWSVTVPPPRILDVSPSAEPRHSAARWTQ